MKIFYIDSDISFPLINWHGDKLLDGIYAQAFDYFTYLIDQGYNVHCPFFIFDGSSKYNLMNNIEKMFIYRYGEFEKYAKHISIIEPIDLFMIKSQTLVFLHTKLYLQIIALLNRLNVNPETQFLNSANVVLGKRYSNEIFSDLLDREQASFYENTDYYLILGKYDDFNHSCLKGVIHNDLGIYYKNFHMMQTPKEDVHMIHLSYKKYVNQTEKIDNLIKNYNVLWLVCFRDERLKALKHVNVMSEEKVPYLLNYYTHYHYIEPRWQSLTARMIAETFYLNREFFYERDVEYSDEALYKYNKCKYEQDYFEIENSEVEKILI